MPRRSRQPFHCQPLAELTRQLLFAPPAKRLEQLRRAEKLHDEIDTDSAYPLEYLVYRVTGYRPPRSDESTLLVGEAVRPDLRLAIDRLSRSLDVPDDDEPAATIDLLAERLNVSTKTIHRWRKAGLRWRWVSRGDGGQKHIVIPDAAITRFMEQDPRRVQRAAQHTSVTDAERQHIIARARELVAAADAPLTLHRAATRLAAETGRGVETVRLILERHDRAEPANALFSHRPSPLTPRQKRFVERAHRRGVAVHRIAARLGRSRQSIHRVLRARRAAAARHVDLRYIHSPTFDRDDADEVILGKPLGAIVDVPAAATGTGGGGAGSARHDGAADGAADGDLPDALRQLYGQPTIAAPRQRTLFVRYNYLKHRAAAVRAGFRAHEPRAADLDRFEALLAEARGVRAVLVRANLPVVLSVARRHLIGEATSHGRLLELLEAGQRMLIDAIETYNAAWSHTFASYLTNRLLRHFAADTGADAPTRPQARRRRTPEQIHDHLVAHARTHGVELEP